MRNIIKKISKSLTLKSLVVYMLSVLVLMFLVLKIQSSLLSKNFSVIEKSKIEKLGNTIAVASSVPMNNSNFALFDKFASQILKDEDIVDVIFKNSDGKILNTKEKVVEAEKSNIEKSSKINKFTFPILREGSQIGTLEIDTINKSMNAIRSNLQFKIGFVFIISLIVFILLSWYVSKKFIVYPLNSILSSIERFKKGEKNIKIEIKSNDEIGILADTINKMEDEFGKNIEEIKLKGAEAEKTIAEAQKNKEYLDNEYKYLERSTNTIIDAMERFSQRDLTVSIKAERDAGEIHKLFETFNKTVQIIKEIINHVRDAVESTASASRQISSSTEEMASGSHEQSAQTTEVAGAIEQMTTTIVETSKNSAAAANVTRESSDLAKEGGKRVNEAIEGMRNIAAVVKESSQSVNDLRGRTDKINAIIQVIDEIADQTNLLALNAAIEAARAGEEGRGFAVVADEVRKLAERTTKATKEIAGVIKLIQDGMQGVVKQTQQAMSETDKGIKLVEKAGDELTKIIKTSDKVSGIVDQVAAASEEQSATAEQISKNIEQISSVTDESASGVQQIAKAAEDLNRLTENLQRIVEGFNIDQTDRNNDDRSNVIIDAKQG